MKRTLCYRSDFLFPDTSFIMGMGSVFNLAGNFYDFASSATEKEADFKALASDWGMVAGDLRFAVDSFVKQHPKSQRVTVEQISLF